jgi:hypothetical protein
LYIPKTFVVKAFTADKKTGLITKGKKTSPQSNKMEKKNNASSRKTGRFNNCHAGKGMAGNGTLQEF